MTEARGNSPILDRFAITLSAWIIIASLMQLGRVHRGRIDDWERLTDPNAWFWALVAAGMFGLWGYLPVMLSLAMKADRARRAYTGLGVIYLMIAAFAGYRVFYTEGTASVGFYALVMLIAPSVLIGPLMLAFAWTGKRDN